MFACGILTERKTGIRLSRKRLHNYFIRRYFSIL
nr:MAG TPA: hypothetical protein [Caudoviricetes sp.]